MNEFLKLTLGPRNWAATLTQIHRAPPRTPDLPAWEVHVVLQREAGSDYSAVLMQQSEERKEGSCVQTQRRLGMLGWKATYRVQTGSLGTSGSQLAQVGLISALSEHQKPLVEIHRPGA